LAEEPAEPKLRSRWEDVTKKDLREIGTSWEGIKRETLNRLGELLVVIVFVVYVQCKTLIPKKYQ